MELFVLQWWLAEAMSTAGMSNWSGLNVLVSQLVLASTHG